jgi:hypothetical protein
MARKSRSSKAQEEQDLLDDEAFFNDEEEEEEDIGAEAENGPPTIDPYEVLGLETEATADDVKKAYRKLALKHHPGTGTVFLIEYRAADLIQTRLRQTPKKPPIRHSKRLLSHTLFSLTTAAASATISPATPPKPSRTTTTSTG